MDWTFLLWPLTAVLLLFIFNYLMKVLRDLFMHLNLLHLLQLRVGGIIVALLDCFQLKRSPVPLSVLPSSG